MKKLILILSASLSLAACEKKDKSNGEAEPKSSVTEITSGEICGWCAKNDTLRISASQAALKEYRSCTALDHDTTVGLSTQEWNDLTAKLDLQKFAALNLNSCAVCYDGCDKLIKVEKNNQVYEIRYERGDTTAVQGISGFVMALDSLTGRLGK